MPTVNQGDTPELHNVSNMFFSDVKFFHNSSLLSITGTVFIASSFMQKIKERDVVLYSSFPAWESPSLSSYMTASQLVGLSPTTHCCRFLFHKGGCFCREKKRKEGVGHADPPPLAFPNGITNQPVRKYMLRQHQLQNRWISPQ